MSTILAIFILASSGGVVPVPCAEYATALAQGQLSVFLDPSEANRTRVEAEIDARIAGIRTCKSSSGISHNMGFITAGDSQFQVKRPNPARSELAAKRCRDAGKVHSASEAGCTREDLVILVEAGHPLALQLEDRIRSEAFDAEVRQRLRWLKQHPDHDERFLAALAPVPCVRESNGLCPPAHHDPDPNSRFLAIEELVGQRDPRGWNARDVALLIQSCRALDAYIQQEKLAASAPNGDVYVILEPTQLINRSLLTSSLSRLSAMGYENVVALVKPSSVRSHGYVAGDGLAWSHPRRHFPLEFWLYEQEWQAGATKTESLEDYVERRWAETDQRAPHPDLEAVKRALTDLERKSSKP